MSKTRTRVLLAVAIILALLSGGGLFAWGRRAPMSVGKPAGRANGGVAPAPQSNSPQNAETMVETRPLVAAPVVAAQPKVEAAAPVQAVEAKPATPDPLTAEAAPLVVTVTDKGQAAEALGNILEKLQTTDGPVRLERRALVPGVSQVQQLSAAPSAWGPAVNGAYTVNPSAMANMPGRGNWTPPVSNVTKDATVDEIKAAVIQAAGDAKNQPAQVQMLNAGGDWIQRGP